MFRNARLHAVGWCYGAALAAALALSPAAVPADEHPSEHPKEHPKGKTSDVTRETIAKAIRDYVQRDAGLKGGYFLIYDPVAKRPLALTLERVHDDRLCRVNEKICFACADFKTPENRVYDLDFFVKHTESGLEVTEVSIHKEDGKPRYNWVEKEGTWSKKGL